MWAMVPLKNRFAALAYEIDEGMGGTIAGNAGNQCQDLMSDESSNMFFDWDLLEQHEEAFSCASITSHMEHDKHIQEGSKKHAQNCKKTCSKMRMTHKEHHEEQGHGKIKRNTSLSKYIRMKITSMRHQRSKHFQQAMRSMKKAAKMAAKHEKKLHKHQHEQCSSAYFDWDELDRQEQQRDEHEHEKQHGGMFDWDALENEEEKSIRMHMKSVMCADAFFDWHELDKQEKMRKRQSMSSSSSISLHEINEKAIMRQQRWMRKMQMSHLQKLQACTAKRHEKAWLSFFGAGADGPD